MNMSKFDKFIVLMSNPYFMGMFGFIVGVIVQMKR